MAFADLMQAGFPEESMSADFGSPPDAASVPAEHIGLLQRLRDLASRMRAQAAAPRHAAHVVNPAHADLTLDPGDRIADAAAIIARHGGTVG